MKLQHKILASIAVLSASLIAPAQAQLFENGPDILVCSVAENAIGDQWDQFVFYISGTQRNGSILYKSLTSNPVLITIDKDGNVSAPNLADCDGKTVEELWKDGRAANFKR